ncbi:VapC toxin family PIN domain ribonuclease [Rhodothermaceae bacterium RA]|nr:VapC toxin family PIN domain ribonuclease [Rhodothermaceae bacterium RA]
MNGRLLLDTNIVIALFAGEAAVVEPLMAAHEVFIPSIVLGELYYGAHRSTRVSENLDRITRFAAASQILPCDADTARWYGQIKQRLRARGRPIPENDLWIAALTRQHNLTLITRDRHFSDVDDLPVVAW